MSDSDYPHLAGYVQTISLPPVLSLAVVQSFLDANNRNISISSTAQWTQKARRHLAPSWRDPVLALHADFAESTFFSAVVALRNASFHQSGSSGNKLTEALKRLTHPANRPLERTDVKSLSVSNIPGYLHALHDKTRRVEIFHTRLDALAESLRDV
ncbi:hypothetical protein BJI47_00125 [Rhodococcus sp. 1168]|nr:hypothetical protein BJI47_00125 [Rhodococcus sp. 1168]